MGYDTKDIFVMEEIKHIQNSTGMYIGSTENATRLVEELLDNALDEVQAGFCNIIGVFIDTKNNIIKVLDSGRGLPFDKNLPIEDDPPVVTSTKLFSSGKFNKDSSNSAYKIAAGLHGIGLIAVNALSEWMEIEIYRKKEHAKYSFINATEKIDRKVTKFKSKPPFSTKVTVKPSPKYFIDTGVDVKVIEERLRIACANFPKLKAVLRVDDEDCVIEGNEEDLIRMYLTDTKDLNWIVFENKKDAESYSLKLAWDTESPTTQKIFSCVNLIRVHSGSHIKLLHTALKELFIYYSKKYKYNFKPEDCFTFLRCYLNLKLIKTSFEAQVKVKLESKTDLSIMKSIKNDLKKYFEKNTEVLVGLLERFQSYREDVRSKKLVNKDNKKRVSSKFTKLRDCRNKGGELLIGEGDSAVGGLIRVRDPKRHAILPLRGVTINILKRSNWLDNTEVKEIVQALGTGTESNCDISRLRYNKIILAADADPAGAFITTLLIILFAKLTPDVIKAGKLYICKTPLFGYRRNGLLVPLWDENELQEARNNNFQIKRFKGLGEFPPKDLKVFTLDSSTRKLIQVQWTEKYEKLFKLMTSPTERKKLVLGEWSIDD